MAIELQAIPRSRRGTPLELDDIPDEVKTAIDEAYEYGKEHPDERLSAKFANQGEAETFLFQARSYARQTEPRLVVTGNSTSKGEARFTVDLYQAGEESAAG